MQILKYPKIPFTYEVKKVYFNHYEIYINLKYNHKYNKHDNI